MAYQLKNTGIAANCTMCIAVDPDTDEIKDFASAAVTADMTVGSNVTIGSQDWDGNTRKYFYLGTNNDANSFPEFGTTKPNFTLISAGQKRTVVFIGEISGVTRVFGHATVAYNEFNLATLTGGSNDYPYCRIYNVTRTGGLPRPSPGDKLIWGYAFEHNVSTYIYSALHNASNMAVASLSAVTSTNSTQSFDIVAVGRRADSYVHSRDKIHAVLIFNDQLSEANFDSLRDDWFNVLLESAASGTTVEPGAGAYTFAGYAPTIYQAGAVTVAPGAGSVVYAGYAPTITAYPTIVTEPLKNNTGTVLASETGITAYIYNVSTGALVATKTGQTTNASGVMSISDVSFASATQYRVVVVMGSGAEGMAKYTTS